MTTDHRSAKSSTPEQWTPRQREVLDLLSRGYTNVQIGERLGISLDGAKWHVSEIISKLGVSSREEAAEYWREYNRPHRKLRRAPLWLAAAPWRWVAGTAGVGALSAGVLLVALALQDDGKPPAGTAVSTPTAIPTAGVPSPTSASPTPALTVVQAPRPADGSIPGLFLLDWSETRPTTGGTFRPIDATTGLDTAGFGPLDMLQAAQFSPSPDGRTLVAMIAVSGSAPGSKLSLIDLATWTQRDIATFPWYPGGFAWTADSRAVYFVGGGADYTRPEIARLEVVSGGIEVLGKVDFWVQGAMRLSADGAALYFLGMYSSDARANILEGDPFLAAFDMRTGTTEKVMLPGLLLGQVRASAPEDDWGSYLVGFAVSPDGSRAYVADSASDRLIVVDLNRMAISDDRSLAKRDAAWKRGLSWVGRQFVGTAHAKGSEYHTSQAQLSPDGRYLYVSGTADEWCDDRPDACVQSRPTGLRVIDTQSMRVVLRAEDVGSFVLSPDGRVLIGFSHWWEVPTEEEPVEYRGTGLQVFDTSTMERTAHLLPAQSVTDVVFDPAGRHAIATSPGPGAAAPRPGGVCTEPCTVLHVIDLQSLAITGSRDSFSLFAPVFSTAANRR